jgi:two-component system chemotaxis response regulator CheB
VTDGAPEVRAPPVDVVAIGASAGGVGTLADLVALLPQDVGVALLVVLHMPTAGVSVLPEVLGRAGKVTVLRAEDGQALERGRVLVAPTDHHLLVDGDVVRLSRGPLVNGHRPAIDPLFESAARSFGSAVMGMLVSGTLDDGVLGLGAIKRAGGRTAVQEPDEALYPDMPRAAMAAGVADVVARIAGLADLVVSCGAGRSGPIAADPADPGRLVADEAAATAVPVSLSCPNCGGALWEYQRDDVVRFECRVGHAYSPDALFQVQGQALDDALWAGHRALLERADLARRMARRMHRSGMAASATKYDRSADDAESRARILHQALTSSQQTEPIPDSAS